MGTTPLASLPYPDLTDPPNGPAQFLAALAAAEKQEVLRFTTAAARNSAITSPVAGMMAYLTTTDELTLYRSGGWTVVAAPWASYAPTLGGTGWAIGNGTITGRRRITADWVDFSVVVTFGSTSTFAAANPTLTLPVAAHAEWTDDLMRSSTRCVFADATGGTFDGRCAISGGVLLPFVANVGATYAADNNVTNTVPFTWTNPDRLALSGGYRPA